MADPAPAEIQRDANNYVVKSSVNVKAAGNPRDAVAKLEHDGMETVVQTIVGIAQKETRRVKPDGSGDYVGLAGQFCAIPADPKRPEVRSGTCYLPDAIHAPIAATLARIQEKDPTAVVRFIVESSARKGGTAGFTWEHRPILDAAGEIVDPLANLRSTLIGGTKPKALPAAVAAEKLPEHQPSSFEKQAPVKAGQSRK